MPRKLRNPKARRPAHKRLADFDISDHLNFLSGWSPPTTDVDRARGPWRTWTDYLQDYRDVRAELLEGYGNVADVFAERAMLLADEQGLDVLEMSAYHEVKCYPEGWDDVDDDGTSEVSHER